MASDKGRAFHRDPTRGVLVRTSLVCLRCGHRARRVTPPATTPKFDTSPVVFRCQSCGRFWIVETPVLTDATGADIDALDTDDRRGND